MTAAHPERHPHGRTNRFEANPRMAGAVVGVILLVMLEAALQAFFYVEKGYPYFADPFQVSYVAPVDDRREYALKPGHRSALYSINEEGYRGAAVAVDSVDVVMLGDSVPFGANVHDDETSAHYLSRDFALDVINGGVPSYLWQSVYRWRNDFAAHRPRVVSLQSANDVSLLTYYQDRWSDQVTWYASRWNRKAPLLSSSALYHYARLALERVGAKSPEEQQRSVTDRALQNRFLASVRETLEDAAALASERKAALVLMPINPFYYQDDLEKSKALRLWRRDYREFVVLWNALFKQVNALMKNVASSHEGIYYFDVVSVMDREDRNGLFVDFIHLSPAGNRFVAKALADFLTTRGILVARAAQ